MQSARNKKTAGDLQLMESRHNSLFSKTRFLQKQKWAHFGSSQNREAGEKREQVVIALDTNVLVSIAKTKIDVVEEAKKEFGGKTEFVVPEQVIKEIDSLAKKGKTMKKSCEIAKKIIEAHGVKKAKTNAKNADSALLELAKTGTIVMTSDRELKRRVKKALGEIIELSNGHIKKIDS